MTLHIKNPTAADWHNLREAIVTSSSSSDVHKRTFRTQAVLPATATPARPASVVSTLLSIREMVEKHDLSYEVILEEFLLLQTADQAAVNWEKALPYCVQRKYRTGEYE